MRRFYKFASLIAAVSFLSGCATIMSGTTQKVSVSSQPGGATAKVDNNMSAKTPAVFTLERKSDHTIEISKEGYKTTTVLLKKTFNGATTGNILLGGIIGTGIDAASGSMNKLIPERVDIVLEEGSGYSEKPKFSSDKDNEFYEKHILNQKTQKTEAAPRVSSPQPAATANFGPKVN